MQIKTRGSSQEVILILSACLLEAVFFCGCGEVPSPESDPPPNIILIVTDDQG